GGLAAAQGVVQGPGHAPEAAPSHAIEHLLVRKIDALPRRVLDETVTESQGQCARYVAAHIGDAGGTASLQAALIQEARAREGIHDGKILIFLGEHGWRDYAEPGA